MISLFMNKVKIRLLTSIPVNLICDSQLLSRVIQHLLETRSPYEFQSSVLYSFFTHIFSLETKIKMSTRMHSSRMHTVCSYVYPSMHWAGGCLPGEVYSGADTPPGVNKMTDIYFEFFCK